MFKWLLLFLTLATPALAANPTCPTRPVGDNSNACASTAFVQQNSGGGGGTSTITIGTTVVTGGVNGECIYDNNGVAGVISCGGTPSPTIVEGSTATSGFINNNLLTSSSSTVGQIVPTVTVNGTPCTLGSSCSPAGVGGIANVSGSAQHTTGTISASSTALTLAGAIDFANGEGIRVNHAGAAFTLNAPTGTGVSPLGTTGITTYQYKVASLDAAGGVGAATASFQTTTGNSSLAPGVGLNGLFWSAPSGTPPAGYAVYRNISGTYTLIGVVGANAVNNDYQFFDDGYTTYPTLYTDWVPSTAPASSLADALITTISSGGGGTSLTLAGASTTAASATAVYHSDTAAFRAALIAGSTVSFPSGTFYIDGPLSVPASTYINGQYGNSIIRSVFVGQNVFVLISNNRVSNLAFQLVPSSSGIAATANNGLYQANIDNIWCQGGGVGGGGGQPNCVYLDGGLNVAISSVFSDGWNTGGAGTGVVCSGYGNNGTGGPPAIVTDQTAGSFSNVAVTLTAVNISNDGCELDGAGAYISLNNCYNCSVSQSALGGSANLTYVLGNVGLEFEGPGQALSVSQTLFTGFFADMQVDSTSNGTPLEISVSNNDFDWCLFQCINFNAGSWATITNNAFAGENNSPWNLSGNQAIFTSGSFTAGPNVFNSNTITNFSGSGSFGIRFAGTMTDTTVCGNRWAHNATNFSAPAPGTGSVFGCSTSP